MRKTKIAGADYFVTDLTGKIGSATAKLPYSLRVVAENVLRQDSTGNGLLELLRSRRS